MKRKLVSLFLVLVMMLSCVASVGCNQNKTDDEVIDGTETVISDAGVTMTLTLWIPTYEGTTEAAILAVKAIDTVKVADKNAFIESTPERKLTWQAQTPQVFKTNAFRAAAYIARDEGVEGTDDASLLEHIRIPVKLVEGSKENIKITDPIDILFAEAILNSRAESSGVCEDDEK
jgi:2-C-methyl-D-erythritol 4-phosphate cytidylyltransferase